MKQAIYQDGVFKPLNPPEVPDGQRVRILLETVSETSPDFVLELAARVYEGLSEKEVQETLCLSEMQTCSLQVRR